MSIGIFASAPTVAGLRAELTDLHDRGFRSLWTPQIFGLDAITALSVIGQNLPETRLGTAVVPTYPRHPMMLAQQALTANDALDGRFTLGIGLSHQIVIEMMLGMSFEKPARHMHDYLSVLMPLLHDRKVSYAGEVYKVTANVDAPAEVAAPPVIVAALGSRMLALAGGVADGTITWMTGPATVRDHIAPSIRAAAADAGRPDPQVVVCLPVAVTDDVDAARAKAGAVFATYGHLPSYRAMLDREGVAGPSDVVIAGSEDEVRDQIQTILAEGATEFVAVPFDDRDRTLNLVATLL